MTDKKMISSPTASTQSKIVEIQPPRKARDKASLITNSAFPASRIVSEYIKSSTDSNDIYLRLDAQADAVLGGDMSQVESMLIHQAVALQCMFTDYAIRAKNHSSLPGIQTLTQLALKAQSGSRTSLQALVEMKNPKQLAFVKQANIAQNQQVNNGIPILALAPARINEVEQNELIVGTNHGSKKVDTRAKKNASRSDPDVVAMDAVNRSAKPRGKANRVS